MRLVKGLLNRCLEVLELLSVDSQWRRLSDIAAALEQPKGAVHRLLAELQALGWVEQDHDTERYRLTLKLALLGQQYLRATGLPGIAQPILDEVAKRCRELVRLTVLQDEALHWLASSQGAPTGLMYQPSLNGRLPLHTTANGKIWLSTLDDASAARIATAGGLGLPARPGQLVGPQALRDTESLLRDLAACRKRGYGLAIEEAEPGVKAIAVVVRAQHDQRVLGTMSIAGPLVRMGPERDAEFHALLLQAAGTLALVWPHDNLPLATGAG
ncbi:MAG: IclR family transcriptional regulator [Burkholderiaceae bacterium]|nr:IclR family transcriptional regulator [Rhodoferax sp.]MCW5630541.1 IclR family transcriptional regulator [Rhodoferax sp.]MCW5640892.1 IclR family transcriptional regulator [Rhodoferax sp.]